MKKAFYFGAIALLTLSIFGCQKETGIKESDKEMVTVTLIAEKAGDETKTAAVEEQNRVSYVWTNEDKTNLKLFVVGEDNEGKETLTEVTDRTIEISSDNKTLTITATVEAEATLRAAVSKAWTSSFKPKVDGNQSPETGNFDPGANILVSEDVVADELNAALLTFSRPVAINKMTLKNLVEGEKIHEVTISSDKYLTGYYDGGEMKGQLISITLTYDNVAVPSGGEFPVYFVTMPNEGQTLTVVAKSDQFVYSKTLGRTVNFTVGKFSTFGVNMEDCGTPVEDTDYTGDWIITGENNGNVYAALAFESGNNNLKTQSVSINLDDEEILSTKVNEIKMHFEKVTSGDYKDLYTIKDNSGNYLYAAGATNNYLKGSTELGGADYYWSIEKEPDGTYTIKAPNSSNRNLMRYNSTSSCFSCYASGQNPLTIYDWNWVIKDESGYNFRKVTTVKSGKQYLIVANNNGTLKAAKPITGDYGYPAVETVTATNDIITVESLTNAFTITSEDSGYTIKQSDDRFWYQTGSYNSFNVNASPSSGQYFTIVANTDETFKVTNKAVNKYLQYSSTHTSYGSYNNEQGVMPYLYELQEGGEQPVTYEITITQPSEGGSIVATVDNNTITTGALIEAGKTISLTAHPATGYEFSEWTVTGATLIDPTINPASITVQDNISISAVFTPESTANSYVYVFTSKSWAATRDGNDENWTSGQDGSSLMSGRGIQVLAAADGANATSTSSFTDIEEVIITYSTNASKGVGSIAIKVGDGSEKSLDVTKTGGTTDRELKFKYTTKESGAVKITVSCSENSIYIKSITIKAAAIVLPTVYNITCATGLSNGSVSADKTSAYEGDTVNLTASPSSGYQLGSWNVYKTDDSSTKVTVADNSFTMPAYDVTISASFVAAVDHGEVTINAGALTNGVLSSQGFTLTFAKNNGSTEPTYNSGSGDLRLYAKGTVTVDGGTKTISGIVFHLSAQGLKRLAPITANAGTVASQSSGDTTVSWSGSNPSVTFTVGDKADYGTDGRSKAGQLCFSSVTITY